MVCGEKYKPFCGAHARDEGQIVVILFRQPVSELAAAAPEHVYVLGIGKSRLTQLGVSDDVHSSGRNLYLDPFSLGHL